MKNSNMPVAIITGAGSGIGRAVAQALSAKDYRLALVGRRESELLRTGQILGRDKSDWIAINSDLTKSDDRSRIIDQTMSSFGRIDTLVNNAGLGTCKTVGEVNLKYWSSLPLTRQVQLILFVEQSMNCSYQREAWSMLRP